MHSILLFMIPAVPLGSAFLLGSFGRKLSKKTIAFLGAGSIGFSALLTILLSVRFIVSPPEGNVYSQTLWTWMQTGTFRAEIAFRFDALSLVMTLVVSVVSFLIHVYSIEFMEGEEGYSRFFSYMNLFVASMLTLVLADNLLLLYLGWEGVGCCSYLLIGFWYKDSANGRAARKAFIVTRIGDTAMAIGLFVLFLNLRTLEIQTLLQRATSHWQQGSLLANTAALLLLGGAVGKSAQLPLQTWLPDAMAGPTPVSALIHAATMVTAGVYLIARMHTLFELAPVVQMAIAIIGAATLLVAALSALTQSDIKRVLAYSTISQIGYMFLALGVGAWSAAIFHFMTHAFFKALLFLAAGAVILALQHEHNIFRMGGLRKQMPGVFWVFLIGASSLSALPLVTAGFYSKDLILSQVYISPLGNVGFWIAGLVGAFLTSLYSFRLVFIAFFGTARTQVTSKTGWLMLAPLIALAVPAVISGFVNLPHSFHGHPYLDELLRSVFVPNAKSERVEEPGWLAWVASIVSMVGIGVAYVLYVGHPKILARMSSSRFFQFLHRFWLSGWGFDRAYDLVLVRPFVFFTSINRGDVINIFFDAVSGFCLWTHRVLRQTQTGQVRWYVAAVAGGAVLLIAFAEAI